MWNQSVILRPVLTVASCPAQRFLSRHVRWSGISISKNFPQFIVIHTVKAFSIVNEAEVKFTHSCTTLCNSMDYTVHRILQARILEWVSLSLLQRIFPTQILNPGVPHCRHIILPAEPQGKPKNTGMGSLSLLQQIFLTQELNWGLLYCRQILYQWSY